MITFAFSNSRNSSEIYDTLSVILCRKRVVHLVKVLRHKLEGRGFDSRWCHWNFSSTQTFREHYGSEIDSSSNRNAYQEGFPKVRAAGVKG